MPTVVDGVALVPPRRAGDCSCTFCGLFRAHHYVWRAVSATIVAVLLGVGTWQLNNYLRDQQQLPNQRLPIVGTLMVVVTGATVLAFAMWYQPIRRLAHVLRPRATGSN